MKKLTLIACLTSSVFLFNNCARNPVTGKSQVVLMSEAQEIAIGREADPQIIAQFGLYENKALQDFIMQKGKQLAAISHRPNINYEFKILDSEILNAFATPGGYVYFTRGIMANFNNEAQFAGVLGHETGHITARHSVSQQRNAQLGQFGIILGSVVSPAFGRFAETASQGLGLLFLKFGRDAEKQADELGVEYSSKLGYDAKEMADFFITLERKGEGTGAAELPEFLSTHPNPGNRNITVTKLAQEWKQKLNLTNAIVNRNSYLQRIEGLIYGEDPKQGFLENSVFYHPQLKFQFPVPQGWNYQNTPQRVQLAPKDGRALMMMTLAPGNNLQEAANTFLQQNNLQLLDSKQQNVNGLPAIALVAGPAQQQQQQQQPIRILAYLIQHANAIYLLLGVSSINDFNQFVPYFTNTMEGFRQLTDQSKLNKKADRIRIKTINSNITLEQALRNYSVRDNKTLQELAILNGMRLTDRITPGTMIKVIGN
ncbi:MAG TPA: M48 family metalloprotease [Chitinophagaceae bacterium]|nr:M48 family metalloprotease [Chitinophagaceae bacterium]